MLNDDGRMTERLTFWPSHRSNDRRTKFTGIWVLLWGCRGPSGRQGIDPRRKRRREARSRSGSVARSDAQARRWVSLDQQPPPLPPTSQPCPGLWRSQRAQERWGLPASTVSCPAHRQGQRSTFTSSPESVNSSFVPGLNFMTNASVSRSSGRRPAGVERDLKPGTVPDRGCSFHSRPVPFDCPYGDQVFDQVFQPNLLPTVMSGGTR